MRTKANAKKTKVKKCVPGSDVKHQSRLRGLWKVPLCALIFAKRRPVNLQNPPAILPCDPSFRVMKLANGMTCYTKINHTPRQKAELRLIVKVGSMCENDTQLGIAHFIEHLAFRQTKNFKDGEIVQHLERFGMAFGADLNASTSFDETIYQLTVPLDKDGLLEHAMRILADWARGIEPTLKALTSEKKIVLEEWRENQNSRHRLTNAAFAAKLAGSRYPLRLPIGSPDLIKQFTADQCLEFFNQWYRPEFMGFIAVGDFTCFSQVESLAQKIFAPLTAHPSFPLTPALPDGSVTIKSGRNYLIQTDPEATRCTVSVSIMRPYIQLPPVADITEEILTAFSVNILNSRLGKLIRRPNAVFLSAGCDVNRYVKPVQVTLIEADCGADASTILPSLEALLQEVYRYVVHGISERELRTCVEDRKSSFESALLERHDMASDELIDDCMADFVDHEPLLGVEYATRWGLAILLSPAISVDSVNAKVRELFDLSRDLFCQAVIAGDDEKSLITKVKLQNVLNRAQRSQKNIEVWIDDTIVPLTASASLSEVDMSLLIAQNRLPSLGAVELVFRSGLRVVLKDTDFEKDSIYLKGFALRGTAQYSEENIGYLEATVACPVAMETGYGPYPKEQIEEMFAGKLANATVDLTRDSRRVEGECSVSDLECLLQLLELLFTQQNVTSRAWELLKKRCHQQMTHQQKNPLFHFQKRLSELTTCDHYFYRPVRPADLDAMKFENIKRIFFESFSDLSQLLFVFTGNLPSLEKCVPLLVRYLGSATAKELPPDHIPIQLRPLKTVVPKFPTGIVRDVIYFGLAPRAQLGLVFPLECPDHESVIVVLICEILNNVLISRLRRQLGGVYNLSVSTHKYSLLSLTATITILFSCEPASSENLAEVVLETIKKLKELDIDSLDVNEAEQKDEVKEEPSRKKARTSGTTESTSSASLLKKASAKKGQAKKRRKIAHVKSEVKTEEKQIEENDTEEDLGTVFVQAYRAVLANQRSGYQTSQRENGYWEDLIYNGCLMYHPEKGAGLPHPFVLPKELSQCTSVCSSSSSSCKFSSPSSSVSSSSVPSPAFTLSPKHTRKKVHVNSCSHVETKVSSPTENTSKSDSPEAALRFDAIMSARHRHVIDVLNDLTLEKCQKAIQRFFPLHNYVLLRLLPKA